MQFFSPSLIRRHSKSVRHRAPFGSTELSPARKPESDSTFDFRENVTEKRRKNTFQTERWCVRPAADARSAGFSEWGKKMVKFLADIDKKRLNETATLGVSLGFFPFLYIFPTTDGVNAFRTRRRRRRGFRATTETRNNTNRETLHRRQVSGYNYICVMDTCVLYGETVRNWIHNGIIPQFRRINSRLPTSAVRHVAVSQNDCLGLHSYVRKTKVTFFLYKIHGFDNFHREKGQQIGCTVTYRMPGTFDMFTRELKQKERVFFLDITRFFTGIWKAKSAAGSFVCW